MAGKTRGALDPEKFWVAWERGAATPSDIFGARFDFWANCETTVENLRERLGIPPLEPQFAAVSGSVTRR